MQAILFVKEDSRASLVRGSEWGLVLEDEFDFKSEWFWMRSRAWFGDKLSESVYNYFGGTALDNGSVTKGLDTGELSKKINMTLISKIVEAKKTLRRLWRSHYGFIWEPV